MLYNYIKNKVKEIKNNYIVSDEDKNTLFERTDTRKWLFANYTIVFFILLSVVIVFLNSIPWYNEKYLVDFFLIDLFVSSVFLVEYSYRWSKSSHKYEFPFRILNLFDLLSFLPFFILVIIYWIWSYSIFFIFRIFRIFKIFELINRMPITKMFLIWINKHKIEIITWFSIIFLILIIFSTIIYFIENTWWNSRDFNSLVKSAWWWIYALTTSWDAWMIPETFVWRFIAWILMSIWPMFISVISSILVVIFLDAINVINLTKKTIICHKCWSENSENAIYCNNCWKKMKK